MAASSRLVDTVQADARQQDLSFAELVAVLYRRRWLLFGGALLGGLAGLLLALAIPPSFTAQTLILLEPPQAGAGSAALDSGAVDSQTRVLGSRSLAREVIARLDLGSDPELTDDPGRLARLLERLTARAAAGPPTVEGDLVGRFLDRLAVRREGKSYVITVAYRSGDPEKAARIVNAVAETYRAGQLSRQAEAAREAREALARQSRTARARLDEAESRLRAFRARTEEDRGDGLAGGVEQAELSRQLVLATADRTAREARLRHIREALAAGGAGFSEGGSLLLQNLSTLKAELLRREAELGGQFGERHPKLLELRGEKAELEARIKEEQQAQLRTLASEAEAARAREQALAASLEALKGRALRQDEAARAGEALEREVELNRRLYEGLIERTSAAAGPELAQGPVARVISEAVPPAAPSFPKPQLLVSLGGTVGFGLSLVLLYLLESRDRGFHGAGEVQRALGLPLLALVPELAAARRSGVAPQDCALEKPRSRYAEALREILAALVLDREAGSPGRVVLVTSMLPDEGKSTLVLSLGRLAASEGLRVLAVDADLRRPSLHALAGLKAGPGIVELLRGEIPAEDVIHADPRSGLRILAGSGRLSQPTRLLTADRLGRVFDLVRSRYDLVLVDAAPLAAVADPRLLAPLADQVLLLVRYGATRRQLCARLVEGLRSIEAPIAGVVLSRVDLRQYEAHSAAETGAAWGGLARYYAD